MKFKDYFLKLKEQGKINSEDYTKFLETVPDGEMPDSIFQVLENSFLTPERAITHPDVNKRLRAEFLDPIDNHLKKFVENIDKVDKYAAMDISKITKKIGDKEIPDTYKQMVAIAEKMPSIFEKLKVAPNDEDAKKQLKDKEKIIEELTEKFNQIETSNKNHLKTVEEEAYRKISDYKLTSELEKLANSYNFADAYKDTRPKLTKAILSELRAKNILSYAEKEDGESVITVQHTDPADGILKPKFNGNTAVTIQSLLDDELKPFLKVNGVDSQEGQTHQKFTVDTQTPNTTTRREGARVTAEI